MKNNYKISIIVPYYEVSIELFKRCISSILAQTFRDFEVLLVDDGNSKTYSKYLQDEIPKDSRIKFLSKPHSGVAASRNYGISKAKCEYICFVDADDELDENYLLFLIEKMDDYDMGICGVCEQFYPTIPICIDKRIFFSVPTFFNGIQYINFCHNKIFKRSIIVNNKISFREDVCLGEDALFLKEYFEYAENIYVTDRLLYHYYKNSSSLTRKFNIDLWKFEQEVISCQWDMFHQYPITDYQEQAMLSWLFSKFLYPMSYYFDALKNKKIDKDTYKEIISEIVAHPLYNKIFTII